MTSEADMMTEQGESAMTISRADHLASAKKRALRYLDMGDIRQAITSMASDLEKHPETRGVNAHITRLGLLYMMNNDAQGARRWIEGFR